MGHGQYDADDSGVLHGGMIQEQPFKLGGRDLVAFCFDEFLLPGQSMDHSFIHPYAPVSHVFFRSPETVQVCFRQRERKENPHLHPLNNEPFPLLIHKTHIPRLQPTFLRDSIPRRAFVTPVPLRNIRCSHPDLAPFTARTFHRAIFSHDLRFTVRCEFADGAGDGFFERVEAEDAAGTSVEGLSSSLRGGEGNGRGEEEAFGLEMEGHQTSTYSVMPQPCFTVSFPLGQNASNCAQISLLSGAAPDAIVSTVPRSKCFVSGRLASCTAIGGTTVNSVIRYLSTQAKNFRKSNFLIT